MTLSSWFRYLIEKETLARVVIIRFIVTQAKRFVVSVEETDKSWRIRLLFWHIERTGGECVHTKSNYCLCWRRTLTRRRCATSCLRLTRSLCAVGVIVGLSNHSRLCSKAKSVLDLGVVWRGVGDWRNDRGGRQAEHLLEIAWTNTMNVRDRQNKIKFVQRGRCYRFRQELKLAIGCHRV